MSESVPNTAGAEAAAAATTGETAAPVAAETQTQAKPSLLAGAKEPGAEAAKDGKDAQAAEAKPWNLKVPEGSDSELAGQFAKFAQANKITQEAAQKAYDELGTAMRQRFEDRMEQQYEAWAKEAQDDKEIGGDKFEENLGLAKSAILKFGGKELLGLLTGANGRNPLGANPHLLRAFVRVAKAISNDTIVNGGVSKEPTPQDRIRQRWPKASETLTVN